MNQCRLSLPHTRNVRQTRLHNLQIHHIAILLADTSLWDCQQGNWPVKLVADRKFHPDRIEDLKQNKIVLRKRK